MNAMRSLLLLLATVASALHGYAADLRFGVLSDFHLEPHFAGQALRLGADAPPALVKSALHSLSTNGAKLQFVLFAGDLLPHRIDAARESVAFENQLVNLFHSNLPDVPVFPVLGNNDSDNGDYRQPSQKFLTNFAELWSPLVGGTNQEVVRKFVAEFELNGAYDLALPGLPTQLVGLNSFFLSSDPRSSAKAKEAGQQLDLLAQVARDQATKPVWLLYHIPPGVDGYRLFTGQKEVWFWETNRQTAFLEILRGHLNITESFCGHTHMDDLRLISQSANDNAQTVREKPVHIVHVVPSVGPNHGNYPAYQIYSVSPEGKITGSATWRTTNGSSWELEYTVTNAPPMSYAGPPKMDFADHYTVVSPDVSNFWIHLGLQRYWDEVVPITGN